MNCQQTLIGSIIFIIHTLYNFFAGSWSHFNYYYYSPIIEFLNKVAIIVFIAMLLLKWTKLLAINKRIIYIILIVGAINITTGASAKVAGANLFAENIKLTIGSYLDVESKQNLHESYGNSNAFNLGYNTADGGAIGGGYGKNNTNYSAPKSQDNENGIFVVCSSTYFVKKNRFLPLRKPNDFIKITKFGWITKQFVRLQGMRNF